MAVEGFVIDPDSTDPLDLGAMGALRLAALTVPPAKKLPQWATNADSDGSQLVRPPYYQNRDCTMQVRVVTSSMDLALAAIGRLEAKLQEAQVIVGGMKIDWTPQSSTKTLALYMLLGEITDMPVTMQDGWFSHSPLLTVAFTCKPFLYGAETAVGAVTSTAPALTVTVPAVPGDVAAEARLVLTDGSGQTRRWVEWGLEQRNYDAGSPAALLIDSEDLATSGFSGSLATRSGGYRRSGASHDTVSVTLPSNAATVLCGTGSQSHVGTFRVKARVWVASVNQLWRLSWQVGDGAFKSNGWVMPAGGNNFSEIDLGVIMVPPVQAGGQRWTGRIEAYTTNAAGEVGEIDYLLLVPCEEGFGEIEGYTPSLSATVAGWDNFTGIGGGTSLGGRTAPLGGTWATSGATSDFVAASYQNQSWEARSTATVESGPRFAILGSTNYTDGVMYVGFTYSRRAQISSRAILRWVDSSNYLFVETVSPAGGGLLTANLGVRVGGTETVLASASADAINVPVVFLTLIVTSAGQVTGEVVGSGVNLAVLSGNSSVLATGGVLASGKPGFSDRNVNGASSTRYYGQFFNASSPSPQVVINSGRSIEIRSDSNLRQSADGSSYGDIASRGSRLFIPPAGDVGRTTRILARAARQNPKVAADVPLGDSLTATVHYTSRYLAVPR